MDTPNMSNAGIDRVIDERDEWRERCNAAIAERAHYGDMMTARLCQCENELTAARAEAAEYRAMIDRCRERNKELGAECERLRDALVSLVDGKSEFDVEYDTGMPADEARKIMDLAYQRSGNNRQDAP